MGYIINFSVVKFICIKKITNPASIFCKSQLKVIPGLAVKYGASGLRQEPQPRTRIFELQWHIYVADIMTSERNALHQLGIFFRSFVSPSHQTELFLSTALTHFLRIGLVRRSSVGEVVTISVIIML